MLNEIETITKNAFRKSWSVRTQGNFLIENHEHANFFRSAKFVSEIADGFWDKKFSEMYNENQKKKMLHVQDVNDLGIKKEGEWLFDICVTEAIEIEEWNNSKKASAHIDTSILWAIESESATSIKEFCADFGKLICSGAKNCLYLHGLNQRSEDGRSKFIKRRLSTIKNQLSEYMKKETIYYIGFWPSPKKVGGSSLWDQYSLEELIDWIEVYDI